MKRKKAIILGNHPLVNSLRQQCEALQADVVHFADPSTPVDSAAINDCNVLFLLSEPSKGHGTDVDNATLARLWAITSQMDAEKFKDKRITCHLMLQSQETLDSMHSCELCSPIRQMMDVYPFTMKEVWSRSIVLDYESITVQSERHAHLVVFGMDEMAWMVAVNAAHTTHYPNYVRNHSLRTRITMVDDRASSKFEEQIQRYQHLFDNSYYRVVVPSDKKPIKVFHKPVYADSREDFVDVEWEFVEASLANTALQDKLRQWSTDPRQLLTVVMASEDGNKNLSEAMRMPEELFRNKIPVHIHSEQEISFPHNPNMRCFGMLDSGYDVSLPLARMAMNVNFIYDRCYHDNYVEWSDHVVNAVEIDVEERARSWQKLSNTNRISCIYNAMAIPTKMRCIGLCENEWDKFYDIPQNDIELLARVEHNRWNVEKMIMGFRPCTDEEQKMIENDISLKKEMKRRKVHYDLRAYDDLRPDETGKTVQLYDLCLCSCLPLIAKVHADENDHTSPTLKGKGGGK